MVAPERIVAAAVNCGAILSLPPPARHHTIIQTMDITMGITDMVYPQMQGFITDKGRFVGRVEGYYVAHRAGQLHEDKQRPELFSEDLW